MNGENPNRELRKSTPAEHEIPDNERERSSIVYSDLDVHKFKLERLLGRARLQQCPVNDRTIVSSK